MSYSTVKIIISLFGIYLVANGKSAETKNILYYGWFLDEMTAESLKNITDSYLNEYLEHSSEFKQFLESAVNNSSLNTTLQDYFSKPLDPNSQSFDPLYHVTAKFCGGRDNCSPYSDLEQVVNNTGKIFTMELIGWFFTNRTYGIRMSLSAEQKELYAPDGESNLTTILRDNTNTMTSYKNYPGIEYVEQELSLTPSSSTAHITIGCAPGIPAQVTGDDLGKIVTMESDSATPRVNISLADSSLMVQYGEWEAFVVYPHSKIKANATFRPYYSESEGDNNATTMPTFLLLILFCSYLALLDCIN